MLRKRIFQRVLRLFLGLFLAFFIALGAAEVPASAGGALSTGREVRPKKTSGLKRFFKRRPRPEPTHQDASQPQKIPEPLGFISVTEESIPVPGDMVRFLTTFLSPSDAGNFGATCSGARRATARLRPQWEAQDKIHRLVGDLIDLKGGTFVLKEEGPEEGEEVSRVVRVKPIRVQAHQLSQGQYEYLMGKDSLLNLEMELHDFGLNSKRFRGKDLPIFLLTVEQENAYIEKLNQALKGIWEVTQLKGLPPRFRRLTDDERTFLATRDVPAKSMRFGKETVEVTAEVEKVPVRTLPPARELEDGPWEVKSPSLEVSARGFYGLVGNMMERTSTPGPVPGSLLLRGGLFDKGPESNHSLSRAFIQDDDQDVHLTLRLALDES